MSDREGVPICKRERERELIPWVSIGVFKQMMTVKKTIIFLKCFEEHSKFFTEAEDGI